MADKELRVNLKADDDITPAAKKAKAALDSIPDKVETTVDVDSSGIDELTGKLGELPGLLGALGSAGAAGGVGALAVGMFAAADAAAEMAISAQTTADLTGSTVEESGKLQNLWGRTGADVNDLNDVLLQMNGALAQAPELAKKLGINLNDGKNIQERFVEVTQMLANGQLTAVEASQLFGEEGVRQVGKLRTMYGGLADDLEKMPAPVDDDDVDAAIEMKKAVGDLKNVLSTTVGIVGKELVPLFGDLATLANEAAAALPGGKEGGGADLLEFIRGWGTGIGILAKGAAAAGDALGPDKLTAGLDESVNNLKNYQDQLAETESGISDLGEAQLEEVASIFEQIAAIRDATNARDEELAAVFSQIAAVRDLIAVQQENADLRRGLADSEFAYRDAQRDFTKAIGETAEALKENGPATLEGAAALDEFALSAGKAADTTVAMTTEQKAAANETYSAVDAQKTWNASMVQSARTTSGPMQQAIIDYIARVNGIPPEKVSEILANPDYASIDAANAAIDQAAADETARITAAAETAQAERDLANAARNRQMTIFARMVAAGGGSATVGPSPAMVPMVAGPTATATTVAVPAPAAAALPPITVNVPMPAPSITVQTGIMGNRFDSQRVLMKAFRAHQRLNGLRE